MGSFSFVYYLGNVFIVNIMGERIGYLDGCIGSKNPTQPKRILKSDLGYPVHAVNVPLIEFRGQRRGIGHYKTYHETKYYGTHCRRLLLPSQN